MGSERIDGDGDGQPSVRSERDRRGIAPNRPFDDAAHATPSELVLTAAAPLIGTVARVHFPSPNASDVPMLPLNRLPFAVQCVPSWLVNIDTRGTELPDVASTEGTAVSHSP